MRLTLRTLLAYMDDTLEPLEIRQIGQKIAESETAQELISRIKQVTRKRRLTAPPATGPNSFEPNTVADYLDNELSAEQVAELEKICLESDVHLAEVASCHQILTLVLGEPAVVPATSKERMYALVRGREAIPFRKAATAGDRGAALGADHDADDTFLLGLPSYRRGGWLRWALPVAGVVLLTVVCVAIWQSVNGLQPDNNRTQLARNNPDNGDKKNGNTDKANEKNTEEKPKENGKDIKPAEAKDANPKDKSTAEKSNGEQTETKPPDKTPNKEPEKKLEANPPSSAADRQAPPSAERAEVGQYHTESKGPASLLVQRKNEKDSWRRVKPGSRVASTDQLVSLPGYASEVWLDCGAHLLLRGHVREFTPPDMAQMDYLQESAVVLHKPKGVDADLTLDRGRLYVSNHNNGPIVVRFRFETKVWDITLQPQAEVVMDLMKYNNAALDYHKGEESLKMMKMFLLAGQAGLVLDNDQFPILSVPGWAIFMWASWQPMTFAHERMDKATQDQFLRSTFAKAPIAVNNPLAEGMERALSALSHRMLVDEDPIVIIKGVLANTEKPFEHNLAIYSLAAMDELNELLDVLKQADSIHAPDRDTAIFALRRWLGRGAAQGRKLYDEKTKTGLLVKQQQYTVTEAERIFELLHDFNDEQAYKSETYSQLASDLLSEKVAIAELARWHLYRLGRVLNVKLPALEKFNAANSRAIREQAAREVFDRISEGSLPPPLYKTAPKGGGGRVPPKNGSKPNPSGK